MTLFTEKVIEIIQSIPRGKVMTYGQIAGTAGNPRAARQVVRVLHAMSPKYDLPWHRVINAKGQIAMKSDSAYNEQLMRLELEGIETDINGNIDLTRYRWNPEIRYEWSNWV